jgi:glycosyltransferase involved in cell wall biosynthesis
MQVMAGAPRGGAEMQFRRMALAFQRAGVPQCVVMRPHPELTAPLIAAGVTVVTLPFGGRLDFRTPQRLGREIAAFAPDTVLSYMQRASAAVPRGDFLHLGRLGGYYDLKYFRRCDALVVNTPDLQAHCLAGGWPRDRVHVITNFVEPQAAAPFPRAELDTPAGAPLLFAMGRLHPNKAFDTLLRALAFLPEAYLWLAGEGPERATLERLAADLGLAPRLRFLGWQWEPWPYLAAADVFVVPSRHEPLGNVVLEGWTMGRPLVAAASQGPSWLIEDGKDGLLVPVDDAAALAAAVRRLLSEPRLAAALVTGGRARIAADFTEASVVQRYLSLFDACRKAPGKPVLK